MFPRLQRVVCCPTTTMIIRDHHRGSRRLIGSVIEAAIYELTRCASIGCSSLGPCIKLQRERTKRTNGRATAHAIRSYTPGLHRGKLDNAAIADDMRCRRRANINDSHIKRRVASRCGSLPYSRAIRATNGFYEFSALFTWYTRNVQRAFRCVPTLTSRLTSAGWCRAFPKYTF